MQPLPTTLQPLDIQLTQWLARHAVRILRLSLGIIFLWFGALKLVPGWSPAEGLAIKTITALSFGSIPPGMIPPLLGIWECLIGIGLLTGWNLRATLLLLAVQMPGTLTPLLLFPSECFTIAPIALTLEGQYIIKNLVLIAGAMVIGSTVRGGYLRAEPGQRGDGTAQLDPVPRPGQSRCETPSHPPTDPT